MSIGKNTRKPVAAASPLPRTIDSATSDIDHTKRLFVLKFNSRRQAAGSIDNSPGGIFLHCRFAPSGRTANSRHCLSLLDQPKGMVAGHPKSIKNVHQRSC